jgi:translocation and assembly module TamA
MLKRPGSIPVIVAVLCVFAGIAPQRLRAADPQPYSVDLPSTGDGPLDQALQASSNLIGLREKATVGPFALISRARDDRGRLETALNSFGYYGAQVSITVDALPLDDPALPTVLDAATSEVPVKIRIQKGQLFHLRRVELTGHPSAVAQDALKLKPGDPAVAAEVLAAQGRMLEALRDDGYALAKVSTPMATLAPGALDVSYDVEPGPRVNLGPIALAGLKDVDADFVQRRLLIHQGEQFDPREIEKARQDLSQVGVFSSVTVDAPDHLDPQGQLPVTVRLVERARHVVSFNAAYSTDLGFTAGVTWSHRNLFGRAERLDLSAAVTQIGGSSSTMPGYDVSATLTQPDIFMRNLDLIYKVEGIKESLDAYDRTAVLGGVTLRDKFTPELSGSLGLQAQKSRVTQEGVTRDYTLLQLPINASYDTTGTAGLLEPTHGFKASATVTPSTSIQAPTADFVILRATGSTYVDFASAGRSVLALRATLATVQGADTFALPPDQRLYAGGSATVRGYKYQSVGPKFADGKPTGGTSLAAGTVEFRQRFGESFGAAVFVDAGEVTTQSSPFGANQRAGAGMGLRYYTPFGPIRADFALPLNRQHGDDTFEVYVGLGEAF